MNANKTHTPQFKRNITIVLTFLLTALFANAKENAWVCATYAEDYSWWCFVDENIQEPVNKYGYYKFWVKWEYATATAQEKFNTKAKISMALYEISSDFTEFRVLKVIDYDKDCNVISESSIPSTWDYVAPETVGESIVETVKEIINTDD